MGAWGTGPFDNDGAADMIAALAQNIVKVVDAKTDDRAQDHYQEARAAARFVLVSHGTDILGGGSLVTVIQALARMRGDLEWLSGWRSPKKMARVLETEMDEALARMRSCKRCRLAKDEIALLDSIISAAKASPIPKSRPLLSRPDRNVALRKRRKRDRARRRLRIVRKKSGKKQKVRRLT